MIARHRKRPACFVLLVVFLVATIIGIHLRIPSSLRMIHPSAVVNDSKTKTLSSLEYAWSVLSSSKAMAPPFNDIDHLRSYFQTNHATRRKVILRVGNFNFDHLNWNDGSAHLEKINCPVTNCHFTSNISDFPTADAVVISQFLEKDLKHFSPKPRHQVWIAQHLEPPYHNRINAKLLNGLVNWTATYRRDSTIVLPYATWQEFDASSKDNLDGLNHAIGRSKKVAMFVSNCNDRNGRLQYAKELNKTIPVHIFGSCGSMKCQRQQEGTCFKMLSKEYKFYLSFENSNCHGYITEKLHKNALNNDIVPVVMGARPEDYATAAPPGSYIHVDDFQSPRHLGDYLNMLDSNDSLYNEFFRFRPRYKYVERYEMTHAYWCYLCTLLQLSDYTNVTRHWYDDYETWWNGRVCNYKFISKDEWVTSWRSV